MGRMKTKLLNKSFRVYLIYSILGLVIIIPIFVISIFNWHKEEAEEVLMHRFLTFKENYSHITQNDVTNWNNYNLDTKLLLKGPFNDNNIHFKDTFLSDTIDDELEPYKEIYVPIKLNGKQYIFFSKENLLKESEMLNSILILFITVVLFFLVGFLFLSRLLNKTLWRPFENTLLVLEKYSVDVPEFPKIENSEIWEFDRLNKVSESLISKNQAIFQNQKEFIENTSHELQTPLAIIRAELEILLQQSSYSEHQLDHFQNIGKAINRLNHLNKSLLILTKLEYTEFESIEELDLNSILKQTVDFYIHFGQIENIQIAIEHINEIKIKTNIRLLEMLISNLISNAIKHNVSNGFVRIKTIENGIEIENSGLDYALDASKLFLKFTKRTSNQNSFGLGLAIVKKIADKYQWKVSYRYTGKTHIFKVTF